MKTLTVPDAQASPAPVPAANGPASAAASQPPAAAPPARPSRRWLLWGCGALALVIGGYYFIPWLQTELNTVSTDDAYVNGHVTYVAPRVSGQVARVLVDDNMRVNKGDLLVQLDKEPYEVQVALKRGAVRVAEGNLATAEARARSLQAMANSQRYKIRTSAQMVRNQVALLKSRMATLKTNEATLIRAQNDFERGRQLLPSGGISREEFDKRQQDIRIAEANVNQAREQIIQVRVSLGLLPEPDKGKDLTEVPSDLDETFSDVRSAFAELTQTMAELGVPPPSHKVTPTKAIEDFERLDKDRDIDRILREMLPKVPAVVQAQAQLATARHDLEQAELNLRYCDIISEIDGVVTSRNVNPGNNVAAGQSLMAVRSLTEIWIDANFKETQLANLRIGQRAKIEVDMYGSRKEFEGRISGFTMGTGQTLALLPPQNATGNFVKIVQRLPVRIEVTDYDAQKLPLFVGLSCTPYVYYKEPPAGPNAGEYLQPWQKR
jgi:membrane fusion protein (multidrug efflux system)